MRPFSFLSNDLNDLKVLRILKDFKDLRVLNDFKDLIQQHSLCFQHDIRTYVTRRQFLPRLPAAPPVHVRRRGSESVNKIY